MTETNALRRSSYAENSFRKVYFGSVPAAIMTLLCAAAIVWVAIAAFNWGVLNATWSDVNGPESCAARSGACWAIIDAKARLILFGLYPYEEQWRSVAACLAIVLVMIFSCVPGFWRFLRLSTLWVVGFATYYILMRGGILGLSSIREDQWGGLSLTLFVFASVCLIGMPLSIGLALLRRSKLPVLAYTTATFIDGIRSLPLLSIMFTAAIVFPFVLPDFLAGDKHYRVIIGFAVFFSCYQAENLRSGIQALPPGQEEAALALGLGYWRRVTLIILPQAFRNALPPTINQFVITFMETSMVIIVGFFDILASGQAAINGGGWSFAFVEVYAFVAAIYFVFVFGLSRYGAYLERRLRVGSI